MPQVLKDEIEDGLIAAALTVFSQRGFQGATMAEVGRVAQVSTGNIYRYYQNKKTLFDAAVPAEFVERFADLVRRKAESLAGVDDIRSLRAGSPYLLLSEQLLTFCVENRLRIVILLGKSQGTRYEGFADEAVQRLSRLAIAHFRVLQPDLRVTEAMRFNLQQIYRNSIYAVVNILSRFDKEATIRQAIEGYTQFHLAGLKGFFE
jgi:AcrR family transcriptional regulator